MHINTYYTRKDDESKRLIKESHKSHKKIEKHMLHIDKIYKNISCEYNYNIIKDKKIKTKYAYAMVILKNYDMPGLINVWYNLKSKCPKYDKICFVLDKDYYETDYLNNKYLKEKKISDNNLKIIKEIFDVVISCELTQYKYIKTEKTFFEKLVNIDIDGSIYIYGYEEYKKILYIELNCYINKNLDFIFDKYKKSTYALDMAHRTYIHGLEKCILLIIPKRYYINKINYIIKIYDLIFKDLFFIMPKVENILYYAIYPNWNKKIFDIDVINFNYYRYPYININDRYFNDYCVNFYFGYSPYIFNNHKERSKFNLNNYNFKEWDENVNEILKEYPEYDIFYEYIKTYRLVNF